MNKKKTLLVVTVLILIIIPSIIFIVLRINSNSQVTQPDRDDNTTIFMGKFVKADLPKGWEVKEYNSDIKEGQILSDGEYSGLVSLEILNDNKVMFSLDGVNGVGYQETCAEVFKFPDTDNNYVTKKVDNYNDYILMMKSQSPETSIPEDKAKIIELGSSYTQFDIFDRQVRRIEKNLYWNGNDSTVFNPECGATSHFIEFTEPKFYSSYNGGQQYTLSLYSARINDSVSEDQLLKLDQILNSLEII